MISLDELTKIGFTDKEARVYAASLRVGRAPVQKIAEEAKVNRATTYVIIEALMARDIMEVAKVGKKRQFAAKHPSSILDMIHREIEDAHRRKDWVMQMVQRFEAIIAPSTAE